MSDRRKVHFPSANTHCAAWHYPGSNGACLIMAPGLGVTKEAGTDLLAQRISQEGFSVLAFEYRRLGESGGKQRGLVRINEQLADWQCAIAYAKTLPEVEPTRVGVWGFSISGSHIYHVAARNPDLGAAISHAGSADGWAATRNAMPYVKPWASLRFNSVALWDAVATRLGREPILIPLVGESNEVAAIQTPDAHNGPRALNPGGKYDDLWPGTVAASSAMRVAFYSPGRVAGRIKIPLLVLEFEEDGVAPPGPAAKAARRAPRGELVKLPGGHYAALLDQTDVTVDAIVDFLSRHLLDQSAANTSEPANPVAAT
jgi:pimeloyl-ACP methyl ester carboxylesterase